MDPFLPNAESSPSPEMRSELQSIIAERNLCGLANDTKWNELIAAMREWNDCRTGRMARHRFKRIDHNYVWAWNADWFHHLPFPMISVEWLDISFVDEYREPMLPEPEATELEALLKRIGFDCQRGERMIRIFGYAPRNAELFNCS